MMIMPGKVKKEIDSGTLTIKIKFVTNISWLDALKLRLAGGKAIKEFIEKRFNETTEKEIEEKNQNDKPNVPKPNGPIYGNNMKQCKITKIICDDLDRSGPLYFKIKGIFS